jgi:peptidoglycan hydrolase-like protein with peptidoglycan-binding domain
MGRLGTFVPRLVALTAVWLLATTALTYAAAQRMNTAATPPVTTAAAAAAPQVLVVPDVRRQAYVFAEGTLGDGGFTWRVEGSVRGFASNNVVSQTPAPGTRLVDTGAPTIVLHLEKAKGVAESGVAQDISPNLGTAVKLADLAVAPAAKPVTRPVVKATPKTLPKPATKPTVKAPAKHAPANRPAAFVVPDARREPLNELPLTQRAQKLLAWIERNPQPTNANVKYWLYQHSWIVAGARMGWWHGSDALATLVQVDSKVFSAWGIGANSRQVARDALAYTEAKSK